MVLQVPHLHQGIRDLCERLDTVEDGPLREDRAEIAKVTGSREWGGVPVPLSGGAFCTQGNKTRGDGSKPLRCRKYEKQRVHRGVCPECPLNDQ